MESCYRICGFQINFYKCGDTLPENFMNEHQIEAEWLVSVQWGRDYKQMIDLIKRSQQIDREICKQQIPHNGDQDLSHSDQKIYEAYRSQINYEDVAATKFKENPMLYMFYSPCKEDTQHEKHVPNCDNFIVFHIKKNKTLKTFRLFQCHCKRIIRIPIRQRKNTQNCTQRNRKDIPDEFPELRRMVISGCFSDLPRHFFQPREACSEQPDQSEQLTCMMVFRSQNKMFSHQRVHTKD